jgi:hypothetical protein
MGREREAAAFVEAKRRPSLPLDELLEPGQAVLQSVEPSRSRPERAGDDQLVAGASSGTAGDALALAQRGDCYSGHRRRGAIAGDNRNARLVQAGVELQHDAVVRLGGQGDRDDQTLGLGAHRGEIAQIDRRGLVAELSPLRQVDRKVDAGYKHVLGDDTPVWKDGAFRVETGDEATPLELREEPALTEL